MYLISMHPEVLRIFTRILKLMEFSDVSIMLRVVLYENLRMVRGLIKQEAHVHAW